MISDLRSVMLIGLLLLPGCGLDRGASESAVPPPDLSAVPARAGTAAEGATATTDRGEETSRQPKWHKSGITPERQQADIEACYTYSRAQVDKDIRIDEDINAARDDAFSLRSREPDLKRSADSFYYRRQLGLRFEECMKSRGYSLI